MGWHPNSNWLWLGGVVLVAAIAYASLFPADWQIRTGLHWLVEHFLLFLAASAVICLAWPRPLIVAGLLVALAGLLELLQGLTPDRVPDLATALSGGGAAPSPGHCWLSSRLRRATGAAQENLMYP